MLSTEIIIKYLIIFCLFILSIYQYKNYTRENMTNSITMDRDSIRNLNSLCTSFLDGSTYSQNLKIPGTVTTNTFNIGSGTSAWSITTKPQILSFSNVTPQLTTTFNLS